MKNILLFGAGKSSTVLIDYLLHHAETEHWQLTVVDADLQLAEQKIGNSIFGKAISFDINEEAARHYLVEQSHVVISLLPPALHFLVAKDCLQFRKPMITASYVDEQMRSLAEEAREHGVLFLCEMGLDPGIDHMSAMRLISDIKEEGGQITSFISHCGGLVAPESDDNPWHYKVSWNPKNVVMAGKAGAFFKENNELKELGYHELFAEKKYVSVPGHDVLCWYPNRDSLKYSSLYNLTDAQTFIRTTLRHPDFIYGWKNVIDLDLTSENDFYETDGKTLAAWFKEHMDQKGFSEWLEKKLREQFDSTKTLLSELVHLVKLEEEAAEKGVEQVDEFMMVNEEGDLQEIDIDNLKINAAATLADRMHDASLTLKQLFFLGMDDEETKISKGKCSAADVLQFALEKKLALKADDKDLVVMLHEIEFEKEEEDFKTTATMLVTGENQNRTAMAQTVGLPLAIATKLILNGQLNLTGLHIPTSKEIYEPVLKELEFHNINFSEQTQKL